MKDRTILADSTTTQTGHDHMGLHPRCAVVGPPFFFRGLPASLGSPLCLIALSNPPLRGVFRHRLEAVSASSATACQMVIFYHMVWGSWGKLEAV